MSDSVQVRDDKDFFEIVYNPPPPPPKKNPLVLMDNLHVRLNFNLSKEKGRKHNS
jgi:hypothetical protein